MKAILAITRDNVIGNLDTGDLPWGYNALDMAYFRSVTKGKCVIVGRTTADMLPPLTVREMVVVGSKQCNRHSSWPVLRTPEQAIQFAKMLGYTSDDIVIAGGAKLYKSTLHMCNEILVTVILQNIKDANRGTNFIELPELWDVIHSKFKFSGGDRYTGHDIAFCTYTRVPD